MRRHLTLLFLTLACDVQSLEAAQERNGSWLYPRRPSAALCVDENPIDSEDYCPEPHQLACLDEDRSTVAEYLDLECSNARCPSQSTCLSSDVCASAGMCETDCCSALVHRTYLEARQSCFLYYGVGLVLYSDGPCREQARYMECELNCWQDLIHCKRSHGCASLCNNEHAVCVSSCRTQYGETPWGEPWPGFPGPWEP